jgi:long-chain acyl-CoA synthetase
VTDPPPFGYPGSVARTRGNATACVQAPEGIHQTYAELDRRSTALARLLRESGLVAGDHIGLVMASEPRFLEVCWAALRSGLYCTPINPASTPAEARYLAGDSKAAVLIASADAGPLAADTARHTDSVQRVIAVDADRAGAEDYESVLAATKDAPLSDETEGSMLLYSSGTTGRPKAVRRPLSGEAPGTSNPMAPFTDRAGILDATVFLSPAPLYHAAPVGWCLAVQRTGGSVVLPRRFDAEQTLAAIEQYRVTHVQLVPTMMRRLLRVPATVRRRYDLSSLQRVVHAAAPCPPQVKREMLEWLGPVIDEYYSGTEGSGITYVTSKEWLAHPGTVGRPILGELGILGSDGRWQPAGEIGMVCFGRHPAEPGVRENAPSPGVTPSGWTTLDDMGYVDDAGYLFLTDRRSHMIVVGGVNVYPREVEDVLLAHPSVADAAVIGVPDEEYGEQVKALVTVEAGSVPDAAFEQELLAQCRAQLSVTKCPRSVDIVPELPRTESGKLVKTSLREKYWEGHPTRIV